MFLIKEIDFIGLSSSEFFMLNLINGAADVITKELYSQIVNNMWNDIEENVIHALKDRKYLFDSQKEYRNFLVELDKQIENVEINCTPNFLIVPTYACNLKCVYCYEQTYAIDAASDINLIKMVDLQFAKINDILNENCLYRKKAMKLE